jgi:hypothetical protein
MASQKEATSLSLSIRIAHLTRLSAQETTLGYVYETAALPLSHVGTVRYIVPVIRNSRVYRSGVRKLRPAKPQAKMSIPRVLKAVKIHTGIHEGETRREGVTPCGGA